MTYRYRLYCPDCFMQDAEGCFDGRFEYSEDEYDTPLEAAEAGREAVSDGIWKYQVVNKYRRVVEVK